MTYPSNAIVMRSLVRVIPTGDVTWEYWLVWKPTSRLQLTRAEAKDYIYDHGLVKTLDCEHGQIWDTPDRSFQKKWKGYVSKNYISFRHCWEG